MIIVFICKYITGNNIIKYGIENLFTTHDFTSHKWTKKNQKTTNATQGQTIAYDQGAFSFQLRYSSKYQLKLITLYPIYQKNTWSEKINKVSNI